MGQPSGIGFSERSRAEDRFIGRQMEQRELRRAFAAARAHPRTVYLQGPEAVGKSALMRTFSRSLEQVGVQVIRLCGDDGDPHPESILEALGEQLGIGARSLPEMTAEVNRRAAAGGLLLCVDDCEALAACDEWLRSGFLGRVGPGVLTVLAGRRPPFFLWPRDPLWRSGIQEICLGPLSDAEAAEFLGQFALGGPELVSECLALSGGMPGLLQMMAEALAAWRPHGDAQATRPFLIEQMLHPGSRRDSVRPGDTAHVCAALAGSVDPDLLAAMLGTGHAPRTAHRQLAGPPYHASPGGRITLPTNVRVRLVHAGLQRRPWTTRTLVRRGLRHLDLLAQSSADGRCRRRIWAQAAHLVLTEHLVSRDEPTLRLGPAHHAGQWLKAWPIPHTPIDPRADDAAMRVAYDGRGVAVGMSVSAAWDGAAAPSGWMERATAALGRVAQDGRALLLHFQDLRSGAQIEAALLLLLDALDELARLPVAAVLDPMPALHQLLGKIGFCPEADGRLWVLEHASFDHQGWLSSLAAPPQASAMSVEERLRAARAALMDLREGGFSASLDTLVRAYGTDPAGARAILLDALQSADLGSNPVPGERLLSLYYLERAGTHEALADDLGLSRATYFRCHQRALRRLGDALFT